MPTHGRLIFSKGCTSDLVTDDCKNAILALQHDGKLDRTLESELNALFESDGMIQIQMDGFVALVESVKDDLTRLFGRQSITPLKIKWAIDTKVQQGHFPGDADVARVRTGWDKVSSEDRTEKLRRIVQWYEALANSIDQGGVNRDWKWNVEKWKERINKGISDEQMDLLNLTFLRSRYATGQAGRWQALTFQRRAKIVFGVGSIGGERVGS
jgi:hypothetical protein